MNSVTQLRDQFQAGKLGVKQVPRWDEYGNGWWHGDKMVMNDVPADWPFQSAGFDGDWDKYATWRQQTAI